MSEWIKCSDRMPNDGSLVIVFSDGFFVLSAEYRGGEFFDVVPEPDKSGQFFETTTVQVTHWQLLPEPPQD